MPSYDYRCPANGRIVEVKHAINDKVSSWGELCQRAGIALDGTAADAAVEKLISGGGILRAGGGETMPSPGACCGGGACGHRH